MEPAFQNWRWQQCLSEKSSTQSCATCFTSHIENADLGQKKDLLIEFITPLEPTVNTR